MVKALGYQLGQLERVNNIGYRLISSLPSEDLRDEPDPYFGVYVFNVNKYFKKLYQLNQPKGCVIGVVIENSPAKKAGLLAGDIIDGINNIAVQDTGDFYSARKNLSIGEVAKFQLLRQGRKEAVAMKVGSVNLNIPILLVDIQEVNAAAGANGIFVTYGLMYFVKSDDEIAAVLGHEIAHIVRGHILKAQSAQALTNLAAIALGIAAESAASGSGEAVMQGVQGVAGVFNAKYSRDIEREADYFGTKYVYLAGFNADACATVEERFAVEIPQSMISNFLSTHPSSPERMLRIRKTVEELKSQCPIRPAK